MSNAEPTDLLVVDDDEVSVLAIRRALGKLGLGVPVAVAGDGGAALAQLRARPEDAPPCLVLLDLNMPGMSGLDLLDALLAEGRLDQVRVLLLSTSDAPQTIAGRHDALLAGRVLKDDLLGTLQNELARWPGLLPEVGEARRA